MDLFKPDQIQAIMILIHATLASKKQAKTYENSKE